MNFISKYMKLRGIFSKDNDLGEDDDDSDENFSKISQLECINETDNNDNTDEDDNNDTTQENETASEEDKNYNEEDDSDCDNISNFDNTTESHTSIIDSHESDNFKSSNIQYSSPVRNLSDQQDLSLPLNQMGTIPCQELHINNKDIQGDAADINITVRMDLSDQEPLSKNFYNQNQTNDSLATKNNVSDNRSTDNNNDGIVSVDNNEINSIVTRKVKKSSTKARRSKRLIRNRQAEKKQPIKRYWLRTRLDHINQSAIYNPESVIRRSQRLFNIHSLHREQDRQQVIKSNNDLLSSFVQPSSLLNHYKRELNSTPAKSKKRVQSLYDIKPTNKRQSYTALCKRN